MNLYRVVIFWVGDQGRVGGQTVYYTIRDTETHAANDAEVLMAFVVQVMSPDWYVAAVVVYDPNNFGATYERVYNQADFPGTSAGTPLPSLNHWWTVVKCAPGNGRSTYQFHGLTTGTTTRDELTDPSNALFQNIMNFFINNATKYRKVASPVHGLPAGTFPYVNGYVNKGLGERHLGRPFSESRQLRSG